jgi:hypothetical protein
MRDGAHHVMGETMKKLLCTVALVGMLAAPGVIQAQVEVGPVAAFHDDLDFGIGGFVAIPVPSLNPNLAIVPNFIYYFPEFIDAFEINGDAVYRFVVSADSPVIPWAMAGLNVMRFSAGGASNTEIGLNLGGGVDFTAGSLTPFAGAKFEIQDGTGFVIFGGLGFAVGGGA